jgi:hypothetical protein
VFQVTYDLPPIRSLSTAQYRIVLFVACAVLLLSSTGTLLFQTTTNSLGIYQISSFDYNIIPGTQVIS